MVGLLLPKLMHQWSTGLWRTRVLVRATESGGVTTRLYPNPSNIQVCVLARKPAASGRRDDVSKTAAYQARQASNCSDNGKGYVANVAGVIASSQRSLRKQVAD